ncbi:hypothetical protein GS429_15165 [Natronorubrum sp. JWXQ-INN-674]|uniref:Small CPxCG-related zinc finger protein n=1 Tax=Natronorubrum halalkaliphilum TaxID=2691917 RepID=A0A6B0VS87_9EURY|nr:hypothetical protein [Natronorubrum halalkaliphilum]MXV63379.1 hypothetical protein [Natronorubrum halalkaliphilum]
MGLIESIRSAVGAIEPETESETKTDRRSNLAGAYWCDDCSVRVPVTEDEVDESRSCPDCGESVQFERSPDSGHCAC